MMQAKLPPIPGKPHAAAKPPAGRSRLGLLPRPNSRLIRRRLLVGWAVLAIAFGLSGSAFAGEVSEIKAEAAKGSLPAPGAPEWQPLVFRSIKRETDYAVVPSAGAQPSFRATSACGASAMILPLPADFDLAKTPRLAWRWRVEKGLDSRDERTEQGDDFAARIYVMFRFDPERASRWQRIENALGRRFFGLDPPGETLSYVWANKEPIGASWTSEIRKEAKLVVLETDSSQASGEWHKAMVDLRADAQRLFSPPPTLAPYALGLMTDSDGICAEAVAEYADFQLLGPASP